MTPSFNTPDQEQPALIIRMAGLIAKEQLGPLSEAEQEELNQWLAEKEEHLAWKEQLSADYIAQLLDSYQAYDANVETSLAAFHERCFTQSRVVPIRYRSSVKRWWAAAAIIVPLAIAGFWLSKRPSQQQPVIAMKDTAVIQPGRSMATLTLANGNHVVLDTGAAGQVMQNGGVLTRYDAGKVAYDVRNNTKNEAEYNTLSTARGGQYQLVLPDGTKVWLNAASSLRYPTVFNGKERHVELTGEAYFEVREKKDQPFIVAAGGMNVTVLGTGFDIMTYQDEDSKKVTLVQGAVKIENGNEQRVLKPDEQAIVGTEGTLSVSSQVDVESVIAWKMGFFQFRHIDLKTMLREIARWYDVDIVCQRKDLSGEFGGRISRKLNLSELISLLEGNGVGHFKIEGRKLIVLP